MSKQEVVVRACYTPGASVVFDPGWPVPTDPEKNQMVEVMDLRAHRAVVLSLREHEVKVEIFELDEDNEFGKRNTVIKLPHSADSIHLPKSTVTESPGVSIVTTGVPCSGGTCTGNCGAPAPASAKIRVKHRTAIDKMYDGLLLKTELQKVQFWMRMNGDTGMPPTPEGIAPAIDLWEMDWLMAAFPEDFEVIDLKG